MNGFIKGTIISVVIMGLFMVIFPHYLIEIFIGWVLPTFAGILSTYSIYCAYRIDSITFTKTIAKGFILKMIYYGISIFIIFKHYSFQPIPFVCSFTCFFIWLHGLEAVIIKRISETYITT